ncbi:MAG: HTTM domain-containing protein [Bacteroidia bacterium]
MKAAIHQFFFAPVKDNYSLAFLRIGLALILLAQTFATWGDFLTIYGEEGFIRGDIATAYVSPLQLTSHHITSWISDGFGTSEMDALLALRIVYISLIVLLGLGLFTKPSAVLLWILHLALVKSAYYMSYGVDYIHTVLLFYCIFFPVSEQYALDVYVFRPRRTNPLPYLRLLQLHMCVIYFFGGLGKAMGPNWWNGESIWKSVNRPMSTTFSFDWMADYAWIPVAMGVSVIILELLYPLTIWIKATRKLWLWGIIGMHLGIAIFMDLSFFAATMILMNLAAFHFFWQEDTSFTKLGAIFNKPLWLKSTTS